MSLQKILVVSSTYPSTDDEKVPRFVKDQLIATAALEEDISIDVLAPHNQTSRHLKYPRHDKNITEHRFHYFLPKYERLTDRGIMPALSEHKINYLLLPFFVLAECMSLYRLTKRLRPDLIYAHWFTPQAINAAVVSKLTKTPFVYTTHAADADVWKRFGWLGRKIVQTTSKRAKTITSVSTQTRDKLFSFFKEPPHVHIIPMGIHKTPLSKQPRNQNILFIGRLTEKKGLQYLFPIVGALLKKYPNARITIAGDGEMRTELEHMCVKAKLTSSVTFTGYVSGKQKKELLASHSYMLVPSIVTRSGDAEGLPVSLLEGLSYGMATIATTVSGAQDIITHKQNGFLVSPNDSGELLRQLDECLSLSNEQFTAVRSHAKKTAKEHEWPIIARRHYELFTKAIHE